jgi:hypothetical protein
MKTVTSKIKEDDRILKRFNRLGKSELYLDLLYFLRFGSARSYSYFDAKFLAEHGARILEDLVIFLADAVASIYIELISVDGDMPTDVVGSSLALCSLSTRELQRMRNEVIVVDNSRCCLCFYCSNVLFETCLYIHQKISTFYAHSLDSVS